MEANIAAALAISKEKEREREMLLLKEKEREREKEKEREGEMEAALYTNCLLLGLDAAVLGHNVGTRVGLFKHSNPRVGEALLHFLLSALRGPTLAAKDFAGVWPIFDAAQSRDFRKIVQSLINELEAHGALPRSNSRVSSLATCCGQRFVELLWQLSAHTLREVHKRSFPADVTANPLPASLTEVVSQNSHAASLLAVTKARIALERKRFVEGASAAVRRQAVWSSLANDLTAEYRALCAEEAYLQQELEKMQNLQDVQDLQDWQARKSGGEANFSTSGYTLDEEAMSVERASVLWDSLLSHAEQHEKLASGPVEDLISHREHRYRIDGSSLRTAISRGASAVPVDASVEFISLRSSHEDEGLLRPGSSDGSRLDSSSISEGHFIDENRGRGDERPGKLMSQLDVAEIIRRWTHALHRLHKQALRLARANDGAGPELLKDAMGLTENGHAQAVQATVAEHRHHLANLQILVAQLKNSIPGMEDAVAALWDHVNSTDMVKACLAAQSALSSPLPHEARHRENEGDVPVDGDELIYGMRPLDFVPPSPALKLPQLLSTSPSSLEKIAGLQKRFSSFSHMFPLESLREEDLSRAASITDSSIEYGSDAGEESMMALRQTLREAALSQPAAAPEVPNERLHQTVAEHYFTPIVQPSNNKIFEDKKVDVVFGKQRSYNTLMPYRSLSSHPSMDMSWDATEDLKGSSKLHSTKDSDRPSSPPLLMDLSTFGDAYDDLLAPMPELDML